MTWFHFNIVIESYLLGTPHVHASGVKGAEHDCCLQSLARILRASSDGYATLVT